MYRGEDKFNFIFNVSTDPALMEAAAPDPTGGLVYSLNPLTLPRT